MNKEGTGEAPPTVATTTGETEPKITVDYGKGRWGNVYHLFDNDGREISLQQKDACNLARRILQIAKGKE